MGQIRHLHEGERLFCHGDPIEHFYIVCSGVVRMVRETPDGMQLTANIAFRGKTIGKPDIFEPWHRHHHVTAYAVEQSTLLVFSANWLLELAKNPVLALNILSAISEYAHGVELEAEHRSTMTAAQRMGCFLQHLCVQHHFNPNGFELPYSKALVASHLGMKPETLSRTLATLDHHGIAVNDTRVMFCDVTKMRNFICDHCSMAGACATHDIISKQKQGFW
jgi:CRP/FNR family transcriptional regulator, dissimilatory nitrate respiration regulator